MHSAFNLFVFPNSMFTPLLFFLLKVYELSGEIALKNNHYYYYYYMHKSFLSVMDFIRLSYSLGKSGQHPVFLDNTRFETGVCDKVTGRFHPQMFHLL